MAPKASGIPCFNPFLVRASVYCNRFVRTLARLCGKGFNPFLVRASVYC